MGQAKDKVLSTSELRKLLEHDGVKVGRFFSVRRDRARVEIVGPDWVCWVTVLDAGYSDKPAASRASARLSAPYSRIRTTLPLRSVKTL